ncbi:MAG: hypothetical protein ABSH20_07240 [Tepidisphaeraceae bacterium]|jgi:hypothetical protein
MNRSITILAAIGLAGALMAAEPGKKTGDDDLDFLLGKAKPSTATSKPVIPKDRPQTMPAAENPEARQGVVILSNGEKIRASLSTTREKPIRLWDEKDEKYKDIPFDLIKSAEAKILWERDEKEWHFIASGSDLKEFTGKTYPARELQYEVTLINGQKLTGGIVSPIYATGSGQTLTFVLNKRQKGDVGQTLKQLVYVKKLELDE